MTSKYLCFFLIAILIVFGATQEDYESPDEENHTEESTQPETPGVNE